MSTNLMFFSPNVDNHCGKVLKTNDVELWLKSSLQTNRFTKDDDHNNSLGGG